MKLRYYLNAEGDGRLQFAADGETWEDVPVVWSPEHTAHMSKLIKASDERKKQDAVKLDAALAASVTHKA